MTWSLAGTYDTAELEPELEPDILDYDAMVIIKPKRNATKFHAQAYGSGSRSRVKCGHWNYYSPWTEKRVSVEEAQQRGFSACKRCFRIADGILYYPGSHEDFK